MCSPSTLDAVFRIVAAMLALAQPGVSWHSRVPCVDAKCSGATWPAPAYDPLRFAPKEGYRVDSFTFEGWSRMEQPGEALDRWIEMAVEIDAVGRAGVSDGWWGGSYDELVVSLLAVARNESAFWRSVQDGTVRGPAGELCYMQIHPATANRLNIIPNDIIGLDSQSTFACFYESAKLLASARRGCQHSGGHWSRGTFSRYGTGASCSHRGDWVQQRFRSYLVAANAKAHPDRFRSVRSDVSRVLGCHPPEPQSRAVAAH